MTPLPPEFIAAIQAAPNDDTPRLVAADWLDEHDDPDWATLIRLQCDRPDLHESAITALIDANIDRWLGPWMAVTSQRHRRRCFERGFVHRLDILEPIADFQLEALDRLPMLAVLSMEVPGEISPDGLATIARQPMLRSIRLRVELEELGWFELEPFTRLRRLVELEIDSDRGERLCNEHWHAFQQARCAWFDQLPPDEQSVIARDCLGSWCKTIVPKVDCLALTPQTLAMPIDLQMRMGGVIPTVRSIEMDSDIPEITWEMLMRFRRLRSIACNPAPLRTPPDLPTIPSLREWLIDTPTLRPDPWNQYHLHRTTPNLVHVTIRTGIIRESGLTIIANLSRLRSLTITINRSAGQLITLNSLPILPELREFTLTGNIIATEQIHCLIQQPRLELFHWRDIDLYRVRRDGPSPIIEPVRISTLCDEHFATAIRYPTPGMITLTLPRLLTPTSNPLTWQEYGDADDASFPSAQSPAWCRLDHAISMRENVAVPHRATWGEIETIELEDGWQRSIQEWTSSTWHGVHALWWNESRSYRLVCHHGGERIMPWQALFQRAIRLVDPREMES